MEQHWSTWCFLQGKGWYRCFCTHLFMDKSGWAGLQCLLAKALAYPDRMALSCGVMHSVGILCVVTLGSVQSVQSLSHVQLLANPWTAACQISLSITNSWSLLKLISIKSVMPSNHLILCRPLLLPPSIFPSTRVFSSESVLCIRWPKYWSFSFNIDPSNEHPGLISFRMDWLDLLAVQGRSRVFSNTTVQKHQFFGAQLSL